ncbi:MAG: glutamate-5-semialdehyde dehydrogenase [Endomicrobiia bacterium]|nr:glutamate-5-semialdehyde dehydrogenase [Endomicrobiia bacterium]
MDIKHDIVSKAQDAKNASRETASLSPSRKKEILMAMAVAVEKARDKIIFENSVDVEAAKESGLGQALVERLTLDGQRIAAMASAIREIAALPDPVGDVVSEWIAPSGIKIKKVRVPLGVVGMIYESRPNVTADASALCIKSGNAVILRGGTEAINSNHAIVRTLLAAGHEAGLPDGAIQFVETADRAAIIELIKLDKLVDLIIPRGSEAMIRFVREHAIVPVLAHGKGLCHTYIDKSADLAMARKIVFNAKCQRPGVCNAMETLLVHKAVAKDFLPDMCAVYSSAGVEVRGCAVTASIVPDVIKASDEDWSTEYLDMKVSVKVVTSIEEALGHINIYGSGHSEAIVTDDEVAAKKFMEEVDAAAVFHNASTRLHDGGSFGLGAEIGISTQKLHARGTMGARELTTTKFLVYGGGHIRE